MIHFKYKLKASGLHGIGLSTDQTGEEIIQNYLEFETAEDLQKRGIR